MADKIEVADSDIASLKAKMDSFKTTLTEPERAAFDYLLSSVPTGDGDVQGYAMARRGSSGTVYIAPSSLQTLTS